MKGKYLGVFAVTRVMHCQREMRTSSIEEDLASRILNSRLTVAHGLRDSQHRV